MDRSQLQYEKELFSLIAEGNEDAFRQLFKLYVPRVQQLIYPIVLSESAVKDIAQEVFLSIWLGRDKLPDIELPQHWISRIAYNQAFRYLKKKSLREKLHIRAGSGRPDAVSPETELAVDLSEVSRLIREAIHQLPEQGKRIFEMNRLAGMKPAEIAGALQISVQAVRNSLTRSAKSIRDYLAVQDVHIPLILLLFFTW